MKSLIVLVALFGCGCAQYWGQPSAPGVPQDTPEVAAAKAAHFAAVARAQAGQPAHDTWSSWAHPQQWAHSQQWAHPQQWAQQSWSAPQYNSWQGPIALPPGYDQNGAPLPVQDTPEVAAEKAKHFALVAAGGHPSLASPVAAPAWTWTANTHHQAGAGLPADTPEVAAAKAAHFAAHAALAQGRRYRRSALIAPAPLLIRSSPYIHSHSTVITHSAPLVTPWAVHHATPLLW